MFTGKYRLFLVALLAANVAYAANRNSPDGVEAEAWERFEELSAQEWNEVFFDPGSGDWRENWSLDGLKAEVSNSEEGMNFRAGPVPRDNASHAVMWTRASFSGDLKIEYEYTRTDEAAQYVNILYIQATGSGEEGFPRDISEWSDQRTVPAMSVYWGNMHTYHISYAAYGLSLIHISEPTRQDTRSRMPSSA